MHPRPRRHGPRPQARLRVSPSFVVAVLTAAFPDGTHIPMRLIALDGGFSHPQKFSNLLHNAHGVPVSQRARFERIARQLRYPVEQIFVEPVDQTPRLVKRAETEQPEASA